MQTLRHPYDPLDEQNRRLLHGLITGAAAPELPCGTVRHIASYQPQVVHGGSHMCGNHVADEQLLGVSKKGTLCCVSEHLKIGINQNSPFTHTHMYIVYVCVRDSVCIHVWINDTKVELSHRVVISGIH